LSGLTLANQHPSGDACRIPALIDCAGTERRYACDPSCSMFNASIFQWRN
jgi:hypothetical protein